MKTRRRWKRCCARSTGREITAPRAACSCRCRWWKSRGAGTLSFPITAQQAHTLAAAAEPAPYGRGEHTLVDPSVRACRQIDAARLRVAGGAWRDTLEQIVVRAATGLGCPPERTCAHLYKLLIYERGGFFAAHRDTEKEDGMVATLVLSLPVAGAGGELIIPPSAARNGRRPARRGALRDPLRRLLR